MHLSSSDIHNGNVKKAWEVEFDLRWYIFLSAFAPCFSLFKSTVEGPLDAAAHEHGDLVKQLRETEAIAELLKRLHKVNDATVIQYLRNFLWIRNLDMSKVDDDTILYLSRCEDPCFKITNLKQNVQLQTL